MPDTYPPQSSFALNKIFPSGRLQVSAVVHALAADGLIDSQATNPILADIRAIRGDHHPLAAVADLHLRDSLPPHRPLDLEKLTDWLATKAGLPYVHIDPLKIDFTRVAEVMSDAYATRFHILPIEITPREVVIATAEPFLIDWLPEIEKITRKSVRLVVANPINIKRFISEFYTLSRSIKHAVAKGGSALGGGNFEQLVELGKSGRQVDANDQSIVHIVDWLWQYAFDQRASDIHLEPRRDIGIVRFRIDGVLHQVYQVPATVMAAMIARIKLLGRMDVVERRRPQDGRIKTRNAGGDEVELRLSTLPTAFGEKLVMRIFDPEVVVRDLAELGFPQDDVRRWEEMTRKPHGIILVTGPTGSGKTTTLYSTLKRLATQEVNVCTVEDPIEMVEGSFNQMQVQHGIDLSFADGLRALMRQDPDIIMVGEIRDLETAEMAIQAALTGHLVFSTLHTNDAPSAITRLQELGVPPYLINATLLGVLAQRLVRTLCPHCKTEGAAIDERVWQTLIAPWRSDVIPSTMQSKGCLECRMTGFRGRCGLYELLVMSDSLREHVHAQSDIDTIKRQAIQEGMRPLRVAGALKVSEGATSLAEVLTVITPDTSVLPKAVTSVILPPVLEVAIRPQNASLRTKQPPITEVPPINDSGVIENATSSAQKP